VKVKFGKPQYQLRQTDLNWKP